MNVIQIENLSKTFYVHEKRPRTIRGAITKFYRQKGERREIKALKNINFSVNKGEFFGVIGRNGSGKSTLIRLIMGAFRPDKESKILTNGKMVRLAMGLGFDGNLSARDNIYINGSILGLSFKEIGNKFYDIIEFAELEKFVDTPVKHYSSGMMAKLKFSVAIHTKADILLIDELFGGVGDISFQQKSNKVFQNFVSDDKTVLFVSHNMNIIKAYCSRVLLIENGEQIMIDKPEVVIPKYESFFKKDTEDGMITPISNQLTEREKRYYENQKKKLETIEKNKKIRLAKLSEAKLKQKQYIDNLKEKILALKKENEELKKLLNTSKNGK